MSDSTIARRYARALYEEAAAAGRVDRVDADVVAVGETLEASPELHRLFGSPLVSAARKQAVVERLFAGRVDDLVVGLVRLLIRKGREALFPAVALSYAALRDEQRGEVRAIVRTAFPLDEPDRESLRRALEAATGLQILLDVSVDPDLISGLVVRVGDTVYDGSARHLLKTLREQFATRTFATN